MSPLADQLCCRQGFKDHVEVFFPEFLHAQFDKRMIEALVSKYTNGFRSLTIVVEFSAGAVFKPMKVRANIYRQKSNALLRHSRLITGSGSNQNSELDQQDSLPIGILGLSPSSLKKTCSKHIDQMVATPAYAGQVSAGDRSPLALQLLVAMQKYAKTVSPAPNSHENSDPDEFNRNPSYMKRSNFMQCSTS